MKSPTRKWVVPLAALILTLAIGGVAFAATTPSSTDTTAAGSTATTAATTATTAPSTPNGTVRPGNCWAGQRSDETLLTGDVLSKVEAAAVAKIGGDATIVRAETDADGNAKYEVHAVKADGTPVTVYVDESYNVVKVETGGPGAADGAGAQGWGRMGGRVTGGGMMGGRMMGLRSGESALTGDTLDKVKAAALAAAGDGSSFMWATTDADGVATYEAQVLKADGTCLRLYLDSSFKVVKTQTGPVGGGFRGGGRGGCMGGNWNGGSTGGSTTGASNVGA